MFNDVFQSSPAATAGCRAIAIAWLFAAVAAVPVSAAQFTVGGGNGEFPTVQAGIDAALAAPEGSHQVRVLADFFDENPNLVLTAGRHIVVSGGWNSTFTAQVSQTTLFGGGRASALRISGTAGAIEFRQFTIAGGAGGNQGGGGVRVSLGGDARVTLRDCSISVNSAIASNAAGTGNGGGIYALLNGDSSLFLIDNQIGFNLVESANAGAFGGGLWANVQNNAWLQAFGNRFAGNIARSSHGYDGSAFAATFRGGGVVDLTDNHYVDNRFEGTLPGGVAAGAVSLLALQTSSGPDNCVAWVENSHFIANNPGAGPNGPLFQLKLENLAGSTCRMLAISSLLADSAGAGVYVRNQSGQAAARIHLTNLTLPDQASRSLDLGGTGQGSITLYNSIYLGNAAMTSIVSHGHNFIHPATAVFWAPARGDYRPRPDSKVVGVGWVDPPGGLGFSIDLDGHPRTTDGVIDIGAYESGGRIFYDGLESD